MVYEARPAAFWSQKRDQKRTNCPDIKHQNVRLTVPELAKTVASVATIRRSLQESCTSARPLCQARPARPHNFRGPASPSTRHSEVRTSRRVLIVEDNAELAFGLRRTLEVHGYEVDVAGDGAAALRRARVFQPHLVILDLMMPIADGFSVLASLRQEGMTVPVLILSAKSEEADKVRGFRAGADDFVTKPFGLQELMERVSALLRRAGVSDGSSAAAHGEAVLAFGDLTIDLDGRRVRRDGVDVPMTPKEFDLLAALMREPGTAIARTRLLREVWGHAPDIQTRTVDIHIVELRRKLEREPAEPRHIVTVWKTGYRFDP